MSPRTGRPKSYNPKSHSLHVRLDDEYIKILDEYCSQRKITRAEGIRKGIEKLRSEAKK